MNKLGSMHVQLNSVRYEAREVDPGHFKDVRTIFASGVPVEVIFSNNINIKTKKDLYLFWARRMKVYEQKMSVRKGWWK
jgi:hypothetical protein